MITFVGPLDISKSKLIEYRAVRTEVPSSQGGLQLRCPASCVEGSLQKGSSPAVAGA